MKKKVHGFENAPQEIVLAVLFYEMFFSFGYTEEEIIVEIDVDQFFLAVKDDQKYFVVRTGPPQLPVEEMRRYWEILLSLWNETSSEAEVKEILREKFNIAMHRNKIAALLEQQEMFRHRISPRNKSTAIN